MTKLLISVVLLASAIAAIGFFMLGAQDGRDAS